jgi:hypothetical protein
MLSAIFGTSESAIAGALGTETSLRPSVASSLLAMAAPMVMSFLGRRMRDEGMSIAGLGNLLQRETPAIRAATPASMTHLLWGREPEVTTGTPVVAQTVIKERSHAGWIVPLILLALIPSFIWLFHHARRPVTVLVVPPRSGMANRANRAMPEVHRIPTGADLYFDTGSARLRPESQATLNEFARALTSNPDVHVMVNGYTDNVGSANGNLRLSQERAEAVVADLVRRGISENRLTARGFGEENPVADNGTADGRAKNRRVSVGAGEP